MKPTIVLASLLLAACSTPPSVDASRLPATPGAAQMGKRAPGDAADPLQVFRIFGTEPFWNVNVEGDRLVYSTPDDPAGVQLQGRRRAIPGGVEITGSRDGRAFVLTVAQGECNDGMSDQTYRLVAGFRFGDLDLSGCGEAAK
ncbi:COG3650 family protein [Thermomonas sp.]|uniref:COG3650 family protein n=1 Tax=Thermomonas sp. TaxID=1971895 RepID=UPI00391C7BA9